MSGRGAARAGGEALPTAGLPSGAEHATARGRHTAIARPSAAGAPRTGRHPAKAAPCTALPAVPPQQRRLDTLAFWRRSTEPLPWPCAAPFLVAPTCGSPRARATRWAHIFSKHPRPPHLTARLALLSPPVSRSPTSTPRSGPSSASTATSRMRRRGSSRASRQRTSTRRTSSCGTRRWPSSTRRPT